METLIGFALSFALGWFIGRLHIRNQRRREQQDGMLQDSVKDLLKEPRR